MQVFFRLDIVLMRDKSPYPLITLIPLRHQRDRDLKHNPRLPREIDAQLLDRHEVAGVICAPEFIIN
jgi:hypothetical protein